MTRVNDRAACAFGFGLGILACIGGAWACGVRINATPSMPRGLWLVSPTDGVRRGDAVAVCAPPPAARIGRERHYLGAGRCGDGSEPLLKVAVAVESDAVAVGPWGLAVNGRLLTDTAPRAHDAAGRALPVWPLGIYDVAPGTIWVTTPRTDSWDSRYWGPARLADVIGVARPLAVLP